MVAASGRCATVAGLEHTFDFLRSQVLGHSGQSPIRHRGYRSGQVRFQFSRLKQEPEERAESRRHQLCCFDTHAGVVPQNKTWNIGSFHCFKKERSSSKALEEKLMKER